MYLSNFFKYMSGPGSRGEQNRVSRLINWKRARERPGLVVKSGKSFIYNQAPTTQFHFTLDAWNHPDCTCDLSGCTNIPPSPGSICCIDQRREERSHKEVGFIQGI